MSEGAVGGLGRRWVVANVVGFGAGAGIFGASQQVWLGPYFEVVTDAGEAARIQALSSAVGLAFFGAAVGLAEWLVLRTRLRAVWWVPATAGGFGVGGAVAGTVSGALGGTVTGMGPQHGVVGFITGVVLSVLALALLPGTLQWTMLRKRSPRAWAWPWVTLGGLFAGLAAAALVVRFGLVYLIPWLQPEDFPSAKALICAGLVMGAVYGVSTRSTLRRTLAPAGHRES